MKKTLSLVLALMMIISTLGAMPFSAQADVNVIPVRWNGLKIEFVEKSGATRYAYTVDVFNEDGSLFVQKPYVVIKKVGNTYQSEDGKYKCSYNSSTGVITTWEVLTSKYVLSDKYYRCCVEYPEDTFSFGEWVFGRDLVNGYKSGFWPIEGAATIAGTPNVGSTLWANYSDSSDPAVPSEKIKRTWQRSASGNNKWSDISGATGMSYTVTDADKSCDIRLKITADDYSGEVLSQPVKIVKKTCTTAPVQPSCGWNSSTSKIVVTNAKKAQEYLVMGVQLTNDELMNENTWNGAVQPSADGSLSLSANGYSIMNYVYTRVKATDTTLASQDWEVGSVFTGATTNTKGINVSYYNVTRGLNAPMCAGDVIEIKVKAAPENATDFEGVEGRSWTTNGGAVAYTTPSCTTTCASNPDVKYKTVYLKLTGQKNNCTLNVKCNNSVGEECKGSLTFNIADENVKYLLEDIIIPDMPELMAGKTVKDVPFETVPANASLDNISFYNGISSSYKGPVITIDKTNQTLTFNLSKAEAGTYSKSLKRNSTDLKTKDFTVVENTTPINDVWFNVDTYMAAPTSTFNTYFTLNVDPTGANYSDITMTSSNPSLVSVKRGTIVRDKELYCTADISLKGAAQGGETVIITASAPNGKSDSFVVQFTGGEPQPTHTVHIEDAGTVVKPATVNETGLKEYRCKECGLLMRTETLAKLPVPASVDKGASEQAVDKAILNSKTDDPKGTTYSVLSAKATKVTKTSVKLQWNSVSGAKKYIIYGNKCGTKNKYKKLITTTAKSYTFKKVAGAKVKKGTYYKFIVVALDKNNRVITTSKTTHAATTGGKVGNDKKVTTAAKKNKVTIKKGKTFKLKAKPVVASKKLKVQRHRKMAYETSNPKVATVTSSGTIKGVKKGTCYVYAYTQNGISAKIKVTIK